MRLVAATVLLAGTLVGVATPATAATAPPRVTALAATATDASAHLTWTNPKASLFTSEVVRRVKGSQAPTWTTGTAVAHLGNNVHALTDTAVTPNTAYKYAVFTVNAAHAHSAATTVSVTTRAVPGPVSGLKATAAPTSVKLTWTDPTSPDLFGLQLCRAKGTATLKAGTCSVIARLAPTATTYTDRGRQPATTYTYAVFAHDKTGHYSPGRSVTITTTSSPPPVPGPVSAVSATATSSAVTLSWTNPSDASFSGVMIRRAVGTTAPATPSSGTAVADTAGSLTSRSDTTVTASTTYSYALFAHNASGGYAAGRDVTIITHTVAGGTWSNPQQLYATFGGLSGISCGGTAFCVADDGHGDVSRFDGTHWTLPHRVGSVQNTDSNVSCPTTSFCALVVDFGKVITFNGTSWSTPTDVSGTNSLGSISCASATFCVALDRADAYTYNGTGWSSGTPLETGTNNLQAVSCASSTMCVAIDGVGYFWRYDGTAWAGPTAVSATVPYLYSVSCPSPTRCVAGGVDDGLQGWSIAYDGTSWAAPVQSPMLLYYIACRSDFCLGSNATGFTTLNAGTWSDPTYPGEGIGVGNNYIGGVSCADATSCESVTSAGQVLAYRSGTWSSPTMVSPYTDYAHTVSCGTPTFCVHVDGLGNATAWNGTSWSLPVQVSAAQATGYLSCTADTFCSYVDLANESYTFDGTSWTDHGAINDPTAGIVSATCTSHTFCMAIDSQGRAFRWNGTAWSDALTAPMSLGDISCATSTSCTASTADGRITRWNGAAWSSYTMVFSGQAFVSLACPTAGFCLATTQDSFATWNGTTWSAPQKLTDQPILGYNTCASPTACLVTDGGSVLQWNGTAWTDPRPVMAAVDRVSCPTTNFCMAIGGQDIEAAWSTYHP